MQENYGLHSYLRDFCRVLTKFDSREILGCVQSLAYCSHSSVWWPCCVMLNFRLLRGSTPMFWTTDSPMVCLCVCVTYGHACKCVCHCVCHCQCLMFTSYLAHLAASRGSIETDTLSDWLRCMCLSVSITVVVMTVDCDSLMMAFLSPYCSLYIYLLIVTCWQMTQHCTHLEKIFYKSEAIYRPIYYMQDSLDQVSNWCDNNCMVINLIKAKSMTITTRQKHQHL